MCDRPSHHHQTHDVCKTPIGLDGLVTTAQYKEPISSLLKGVKYGGVFDVMRVVAKLTHAHWPIDVPKLDLLIPIPLHQQKKRLRGFNQAELFAKELGKLLNIPVETNCLEKTTRTPPQASFTRKQRVLRTDFGFDCVKSRIIQEKNIGLVDDIMTTGSTMRAGGSVLKRNGAKEVWAIVFAHAY